MNHGTVSVAQNKLGARKRKQSKKGAKARKELNLDLARVHWKAHALPLCYGPVGGRGFVGEATSQSLRQLRLRAQTEP